MNSRVGQTGACRTAALTCASAMAGIWQPHWAMAWLRAVAAAMAKSEGTQEVVHGLTKATGALQRQRAGGVDAGGGSVGGGAGGGVDGARRCSHNTGLILASCIAAGVRVNRLLQPHLKASAIAEAALSGTRQTAFTRDCKR